MVTEVDLDKLERKVAEARGRLMEDIRQLRQPHVVAEAKDELIDRGMVLKDDVVRRAQGMANDRVSGFVEDVKQRVMQNPAAALAIGAGVAWHLYRKPPVSSLLIGVGVASLLRQKAPVRDVRYEPYARRRPSAYVPGGVAGYGYPVEPEPPGSSLVDRSRETAEQLGARVVEWANETGQSLSRSTSELASRAGEAAEAVMERAGDAATQLQERAGVTAEAIARRASERAEDLASSTRARLAELQRTSMETAGRIGEAGRARALSLPDRFSDPQTSETILMSAAGLAVGAALGLALTRKKRRRF